MLSPRLTPTQRPLQPTQIKLPPPACVLVLKHRTPPLLCLLYIFRCPVFAVPRYVFVFLLFDSCSVLSGWPLPVVRAANLLFVFVCFFFCDRVVLFADAPIRFSFLALSHSL